MGTSLRIDCGPGSHIVYQDTENRILSENMANHLMMVGLILLAGTTMTLSQTPPKDEDCPFGPGSCPVTLDNVVDVYFHDVDDIRSCQRECRQIEECHFFTMFPESDDPHDHMKCFLFKTCDHLEACDDCMTGPELPIIDDDSCNNNDGNYTCETALDNVVDVYYFDVEDTFSCKDQCNMLDDCNFWTFFDVQDAPQPHHKCFLFKECNIHEPCKTCETGPKGKYYPRTSSYPRR